MEVGVWPDGGGIEAAAARGDGGIELIHRAEVLVDDRLSPRPLLLIHGAGNEVLPDACSRDIHARARMPKELILYPGCGHGLDQCRKALDRDLTGWLGRVVLHGPQRYPPN